MSYLMSLVSRLEKVTPEPSPPRWFKERRQSVHLPSHSILVAYVYHTLHPFQVGWNPT